jgi:hypothetical protein
MGDNPTTPVHNRCMAFLTERNGALQFNKILCPQSAKGITLTVERLEQEERRFPGAVREHFPRPAGTQFL